MIAGTGNVPELAGRSGEGRDRRSRARLLSSVFIRMLLIQLFYVPLNRFRREGATVPSSDELVDFGREIDGDGNLFCDSISCKLRRMNEGLKCGGREVGVAVLEERCDHLLVYSIAVAPTEQRLGHGRALLEFADQRAAAIGAEEIRLYTNLRMEKNIALYRRHGYVEAGIRPHPSRPGEMLVDMTRSVVLGTP